MSPRRQEHVGQPGRANHVAEVDVATRQVKRTSAGWQARLGPGPEPDGKTLFVANGLSDDMTLVDTQSGKAIRTVAAGRVPHTPWCLNETRPATAAPGGSRGGRLPAGSGAPWSGVAAAQTVPRPTPWPWCRWPTTPLPEPPAGAALPRTPGGRAAGRGEMGASDAEVGLRAAGQALKVVEATASNAAELPQLLANSRPTAWHWVLDLPDDAELPQAVKAALGGRHAVQPRRQQRRAARPVLRRMLFHTYPSQAMLNDALAQYLAARSGARRWCCKAPPRPMRPWARPGRAPASATASRPRRPSRSSSRATRASATWATRACSPATATTRWWR
jgi:YVTN family beta-propeller protein